MSVKSVMLNQMTKTTGIVTTTLTMDQMSTTKIIGMDLSEQQTQSRHLIKLRQGHGHDEESNWEEKNTLFGNIMGRLLRFGKRIQAQGRILKRK